MHAIVGRLPRVVLLVVMLALPGTALAARSASYDEEAYGGLCDHLQALCTDTARSTVYRDEYVGHDEPSLLFYSDTPGSGNSNLYHLRLPTDPPTLPTQDGAGGTFNFQLHIAFWLGMAMCDTQSYPEYTTTCAPDSDANIFNSPDPNAPDFIGHHPGTAFMEMQFYPPGWVPWPAGASCDATQWCAALNIDSFSLSADGTPNNAACVAQVGIEPVNFAFITKSGVADRPANPVQTPITEQAANPATDLFMGSGDQLTVDMHDTAAGFQVVIHDQTTGQDGAMTASAANGFGQVRFDPAGNGCTNIPSAFHPMYSTSSEQTTVPWAVHSYNVAFSDEIGHWEYCATINADGTCADNPSDPTEGDFGDDSGCFAAAASTRVAISGCLGTDDDFDGVGYQTVWPGSTTKHGQEKKLYPSALEFSSPLFNSTRNYDRVAFETDLPAIEGATNPPCDTSSGSGCVNPPVGANFYPIYTTRGGNGNCVWQFGGPNIPGTKDTFGGTSASEYGATPLILPFPFGGNVFEFVSDFRNILGSNPCPVKHP